MIDQSGWLIMPMFGCVDTIGVSTNELPARISNGADAEYRRNRNVTVAPKEAAIRVITIDGLVRQPGIYSTLRDTTLLQVIAVAKGTNGLANLHLVVV